MYVEEGEILMGKNQYLCMVKCKLCGSEWPYASEQAASIDLFGACICCRKNDMDQDEILKVCEECRSRGGYPDERI